MYKKFDAIIFDLDDTLFKTTEKLTNPSFDHAFKVMIDNGLHASVKECFEERAQTITKYNRDQFFEHLVENFKIEGSKKKCRQLGVEAFQERMKEVEIAPSIETHQVLRELAPHTSLFLVTAGSRPTQKGKVKLLEIGSYFTHIFYVETKRNERKRDSFFEIVHTLQSPPEKLLSVGNRLDIEITDSKELGLKTCHILQGEYAHIQPRSQLELPDYTIHQIQEITKICQT